MADSKACYPDSKIRFLKCVIVVMDTFTAIVSKLMEKSPISAEVTHSSIYGDQHFKKKLTTTDHTTLQTLLTDGYSKLDLTLMFKIITYFKMFVSPPTRGWNSTPVLSETTIGDDTQRIRLKRNHFMHQVSTAVSEQEFEDFFSETTLICKRIDSYLKNTREDSFEQDVANIKVKPLVGSLDVQTKYDKERSIEEFFATKIGDAEFKVYKDKSIKDVLQTLRDQSEVQEQECITLTFPELSHSELHRIKSDLLDEINKKLVNIKVERIREGSLVIELLFPAGILLKDDLLQTSIKEVLDILCEVGVFELDVCVTVDVVISANEVCQFDDQDEFVENNDARFSKGSLQLDLRVNMDAVQSEEGLKEELDNLFGNLMSVSNGGGMFTVDEPVVSFVQPKLHDEVVKSCQLRSYLNPSKKNTPETSLIVAGPSGIKRSLPEELREHLDEIRGKVAKASDEKEESIRKHMKEMHTSYVNGWEKDEKTFTVTRATKQVASLIKENNVVVVVGSSGSGKSSIIHHVALNLKTEHEYDIIPIVTSPVDIIQYRDVNKNQLFVIDDLCGKNYLDETDLEAWKNKSKIIEKLFPEPSNEQGKLKILVSCRLQIFNTEKFKNLHLFTKEAVDLQSQKYCLLADEKLKMTQKYLKVTEEDWQEINKDLAGCQYFPLLCKLGQDKNMEEFKHLIASPIDCIRKDLRDTIQNKPMENCALVLCMLFPDGFHEDFIDPETRPQDVQQKLTDIIKNFKEVTLDNEREIEKIRKTFEQLDGTYVKKLGPMYTISHDKMYDMVAVEGSHQVTKLFLKYAPSTLVAEQYRLKSVFKVDDNDILIYLNENYENLYFDRIIQDLKEAKSYQPFFHNQQLKEEKYRRKVMEYIEQNRKSCDELFRRLDREGMTEERKSSYRDDTYTYRTTPVIEATKTGFYDLVQYFIQINCDCNKKDSYDGSPLYYSCLYGFVKVTDLLMRHGVEYGDELVKACMWGIIKIVRGMTDGGGDLSVCHSVNGRTPLTAACREGQIEVVELLLDKGADPLQTDGRGDTALDATRRRERMLMWKDASMREMIYVDDTIINLLKSHMKQ